MQHPSTDPGPRHWDLLAADPAGPGLQRLRDGRAPRALRGPGAALARDAVARVTNFPAASTIIAARERPTHGLILLQGLACQQSFAADGARQITALAVPGEVLNLEALMLHPNGQDVVAADRCCVGVAPLPALSALLGAGSLGLRMLLRQFAIQRQWLVCVGQRSALARTAHLICELLVRLEEAGRSDGRSFEFPMTQIDLADALGLSSVHVNRTVQTLRREGLISWRGRTVEVHDRPGLESVARFDGEYLVQLEA